MPDDLSPQILHGITSIWARMVLVSQELVLRVASQNSSHEEININTLKGRDLLVLSGKGKDPWIKNIY